LVRTELGEIDKNSRFAIDCTKDLLGAWSEEHGHHVTRIPQHATQSNNLKINHFE
jgi:hypothetical protein